MRPSHESQLSLAVVIVILLHIIIVILMYVFFLLLFLIRYMSTSYINNRLSWSRLYMHKHAILHFFACTLWPKYGQRLRLFLGRHRYMCSKPLPWTLRYVCQNVYTSQYFPVVALQTGAYEIHAFCLHKKHLRKKQIPLWFSFTTKCITMTYFFIIIYLSGDILLLLLFILFLCPWPPPNSTTYSRDHVYVIWQ